MPSKKHKEEIIGRRREVELVLAQGASSTEARRRVGMSERAYIVTHEHGLQTDQARRRKDLEKESRLRHGDARSIGAYDH